MLFRKKQRKLTTAILISCILLLAAIIKIIYPSQLLLKFYIILSIFEVMLATSLLMFSHLWQMWVSLLLVFAAWSGHAFFLTCFGLPCPCWGSAIALPRGSTLVIDLALLLPTWGVVAQDRRVTSWRRRQIIYLSLLFFILGFLFPKIIYN